MFYFQCYPLSSVRPVTCTVVVLMNVTNLTTWDEVEALKQSLRQVLTHHGIEQSVIEIQQGK